MTRKEITDRVQMWLGMQQLDDYNEIPLIQDMIYRGTIDLLARTRCVARCVHLHTQANVGVYTLDHSILALVDVDNGDIPRRRRDQTTYMSGVVGTVVYPPGYVASGPFSFTMIRSDLLRVNPTPSENGELDVWAVLRPQKMDEDTDSPGDAAYGAIPEEFQDAIELYALWKTADYSDDASSQNGERYRIQYEGPDGRGGKLAQIRTLANKRGTSRSAPRNVRIRPVSDSSAWVG